MIRRLLASFALALLAGTASAAACPMHYLDGRLPEIRNPRLATATRELCYGVFAVVHSGVTRTPLWSAEHLRADNLELAGDLSRKNSFHPEQRLPASERAELRDYARSGFDRGHMAPSANMPTRRTQHESFTLANMVPQDRDNNREVWAGIEGTVRKMASQDGDLYVITGPAFIGSTLQKVGNVLVPSHLYKAVYSPRQKAGVAWFVENRDGVDARVMTIAQLEAHIGIDLMPALVEAEKQRLLRVPKSRTRKKAPARDYAFGAS